MDSKARIQRLDSSEEGTFGRFTYNDFSCFVGELPWRDNQPNISCIPPGSYKCVYTASTRFKKEMYEVVGVNGRTGIRIHSANFMGNDALGYKKQLNGCIAPGLKLGVMDRQKALLLSKPALRLLEALFNQKTFILEIE